MSLGIKYSEIFTERELIGTASGALMVQVVWDSWYGKIYSSLDDKDTGLGEGEEDED